MSAWKWSSGSGEGPARTGALATQDSVPKASSSVASPDASADNSPSRLRWPVSSRTCRCSAPGLAGRSLGCGGTALQRLAAAARLCSSSRQRSQTPELLRSRAAASGPRAEPSTAASAGGISARTQCSSSTRGRVGDRSCKSCGRELRRKPREATGAPPPRFSALPKRCAVRKKLRKALRLPAMARRPACRTWRSAWHRAAPSAQAARMVMQRRRSSTAVTRDSSCTRRCSGPCSQAARAFGPSRSTKASTGSPASWCAASARCSAWSSSGVRAQPKTASRNSPTRLSAPVMATPPPWRRIRKRCSSTPRLRRVCASSTA
mmetsp:Transcript_19033/g.60473  ORF Transcript_19033/g.60473 Transcript_19033/m.60473 type:complete len:320 (+) Transcript_19033:1284-2243(+)